MAHSSSAVQVQQKLPAGAKTPAKSSTASVSDKLKILVDVLASQATTAERHEYFTQMAQRMSFASLKRAVESLTPLCEESEYPKFEDARKEAQKLREIFWCELKHQKARVLKPAKVETAKPIAKAPVAQKVVSISSATAVRPRPTPTPAPTPLTGIEEVAQARKKMKALGPAGRPTQYAPAVKEDCDLTTMSVPDSGEIAKPPWPGNWSPSPEAEVGGKSGVTRHVAHGKYGAD